ncbi:hypothetical protein RBH29_17015 [Herbivorax sp. ANBcel31]|uniref:hypothetical protein n=1 Tax=Herbivorax sp. ANBcel31 TaxID=3069754 RepID=UPI0027B136D1|nr:hypothetical protein [Herbivorax sp. ANBcel31]MDQ2088130.1 hypothetical protein [Herbivorax sp. ANBcel31]
MCDKIVRELIEKIEDDFYILHVENAFKIENKGIVMHGSNEGKICIGDKLKEIESGGIFRILGIDHFYCSNKEKRDEINKGSPILIETVENKEFFKDKVLIKV